VGGRPTVVSWPHTSVTVEELSHLTFNSMHLGGCIAEAPFPIVETLATIMKSEKQKKNAEDEVSVIVICSPLN
jgi:hypothetical protein